MSHLSRRRVLSFAIAIITCAVVLGQAVLARAIANPPPNASGEDRIAAALALARERGAYRFDGDVTQVTLPSAIVTNIGRASRADQYHVEGKTDLRQANLEMNLWSGGGSVQQPEGAVGVRVQDGKTFVRQGTGEWKEDGSFSSDGIAPQGDFLAFLKAVRDVEAHTPETRAGIAFTRYTFQVDGPAFADWARDQMEAALIRRGELPAGTRLTASEYYRDMTGEGELWVREDGLPLRQILTLRFPEQRNESVHAQISVTFSEFGPPAPEIGFLGEIRFLDATPALIVLVSLLLIGLLMRFHASRRVQRAVVVAMTAVLMSSAPLDGLKQASLLSARTAHADSQEKAQSEAQALSELRRLDAKEQFNPHQSPLDAAAQPSLLRRI